MTDGWAICQRGEDRRRRRCRVAWGYADKSVVSLRDTLAFSPGVYLQPRYGQEVRISIRGSGRLSRGFHMRGLTVLHDGVPMPLLAASLLLLGIAERLVLPRLPRAARWPGVAAGAPARL